MDYEQKCAEKIQSMDAKTYNRFCGVIMKAQRGEISWEELWKKHLKDANRVSLHG